MTLPTVHLNGTGRAALIAQYEAAWDATNTALKAMEETSPNGRDYYPQGPQAIGQAEAEYRSRCAALRDVKRELEAILTHLNSV